MLSLINHGEIELPEPDLVTFHTSLLKRICFPNEYEYTFGSGIAFSHLAYRSSY